MSNIPKLDCERDWKADVVGNRTSLQYIKKQLYRGNWSYLHRHPELRAIIRVFLHELITKQPENIYEFSAALFNCNNTRLLVTKINQQLNQINKNLKESPSAHDDKEMCSWEVGSTHSLLSDSCAGNDMENMLRFAILLRDQK